MLTQPGMAARRTLAKDLCDFLGTLPVVERCYTFGSEARGEEDRWSDIDLLLVVSGFPGCCWNVVGALNSYRPFRYHGMLMSTATSACMLGTVLRNESVFHKVDLNLMDLCPFERGEDVARFGTLAECKPGYLSVGEYPPERLLVSRLRRENEMDWSLEHRIGTAMHFAYSEVKSVLRGQTDMSLLRQRGGELRAVLQEIPARVAIPGGDLRTVAEQWLAASDFLIGTSTGRQ